jgi:hypothetical protein
MVKVFPDAVYPYATTVPLNPSKTPKITGSAEILYTSSYVPG